jgi:hypothetical protein
VARRRLRRHLPPPRVPHWRSLWWSMPARLTWRGRGVCGAPFWERAVRLTRRCWGWWTRLTDGRDGLPASEEGASNIKRVVALMAVGVVSARKRRRLKAATWLQFSELTLATRVQGGVPKDRIAITAKPSRRRWVEVVGPGRLGWVCNKARRAAVDPRGFPCAAGGGSASVGGEMTSNRQNAGCLGGSDGWERNANQKKGALRSFCGGKKCGKISGF